MCSILNLNVQVKYIMEFNTSGYSKSFSASLLTFDERHWRIAWFCVLSSFTKGAIPFNLTDLKLHARLIVYT